MIVCHAFKDVIGGTKLSKAKDKFNEWTHKNNINKDDIVNISVLKNNYDAIEIYVFVINQ